MALTKSRNRMTAGAARTPIDYNDAASDGTTDARAAILSAMGSGYCHITPGIYRIASNLTLTGVVRISPGAVLKPAAGVTVTMDCLIEAGLYQIFDHGLGGTVVSRALAPRINTKAYPEWWGALPGNGANHSPYIQAAINFIQNANGGTVYLNGWYTCAQGLFVSGRVRIEGQGPVWGANVVDIERSSTLDFSTTPSGLGGILVQNGTGIVVGFELINVGIFKNPTDAANATSFGLNMVAPRHFRVEGCMIFGFSICVQITDSPASDGAGVEGIFDGCIIALGSAASLIVSGITSLTFRDCSITTGTANVLSTVIIRRGSNGFVPDTITFIDCRILCLVTTNRSQTMVTITDGMWINFIRTDIEGASVQGILIQRDATAGDHNIGLKTIDVTNCWFDNTGRCVVFSGRRANGRIEGCRMDSVAVEFSSQMDADISIRGNNIRSGGSVGAVTITNASGVRVSDNYVFGDGAGLTAPGVLLTSTTANCIVTGNRVLSNHASPILNAGTGNVLANNIVSVV